MFYRGQRDPETGQAVGLVVEDTITGRTYPIVEQPLANTEGFERGYAGTGPHNTARAILDDLLGTIPDSVNEFEREVIAEPKSTFELTDETIYAWMSRHGYS